MSADGLLGLLNMFTEEHFLTSIFVLGSDVPYISASIVIQLLGMAIPYFQSHKEKEKVVEGRLTT